MALYPSLEDLKMTNMIRAQIQEQAAASGPAPSAPLASPSGYSYPYPTLDKPTSTGSQQNLDALYPTFNNYMGLDLTSSEIAALMPSNQSRDLVSADSSGLSYVAPGGQRMLAPLSGTAVGLRRAQVTHGIRELTLCKDKDGQCGLRVKDINKGVFVVFVKSGSPAALAGLRFGDQILQINDICIAGFTMEKVHDMIIKSPANGINLVVRDRPFERNIVVHKDSAGHVGFAFKDGKIISIVKDSSAARNGLLTEHHMLEVNGQNVVGMNDKDIRKIIESGGDVIALTIMPSFIYQHMMKHMATSLVRKFMDHSVIDI